MKRPRNNWSLYVVCLDSIIDESTSTIWELSLIFAWFKILFSMVLLILHFTYLVYIFVLYDFYDLWWLDNKFSKYVKYQTNISSWSKYCLLSILFFWYYIFIFPLAMSYIFTAYITDRFDVIEFLLSLWYWISHFIM